MQSKKLFVKNSPEWLAATQIFMKSLKQASQNSTDQRGQPKVCYFFSSSSIIHLKISQVTELEQQSRKEYITRAKFWAWRKQDPLNLLSKRLAGDLAEANGVLGI